MICLTHTSAGRIYILANYPALYLTSPLKAAGYTRPLRTKGRAGACFACSQSPASQHTVLSQSPAPTLQSYAGTFDVNTEDAVLHVRHRHL